MPNLLTKARKGDSDAFSQLIKPHEKLIYNIALRYARSAEDAKDITQETFIKIYKNLGACKKSESFKSWTARIAVTTSLDFLRAKGRKSEDSLEEREEAGKFERSELSEADPALSAERRETGEAVRRAVSRLPGEQSALIILRDMQNFSYDEIAEVMKIPVGTVKSRLSRARLKLKELLSREPRLYIEGRD